MENTFETFLSGLDPAVALILRRINEWDRQDLIFNLHIKQPCEDKQCTGELNAVVASISNNAVGYRDDIAKQNELKRDVLFNVVGPIPSVIDRLEIANSSDLIGNDLVELPDDVIFGVIEGNQVFRFSCLDFDGLKLKYINPYTTKSLSSEAKNMIGTIEDNLKRRNIKNVLTLTETIDTLVDIKKLPPSVIATIA